MEALARALAVTLKLCCFSSARRTSRRFCLRRSTKLSRPPLCSVSADKGTKESKEVRGLRPNSSSKGVMFEGKATSGKVRLIQIAGDTY